MLDLTTQFFDHVASEGARLGWPQDRLLKLGSVSPASLLASVPRNSFVGQALAIGREVTRAMAFLSKNAVDYCRAGRISEAERDRIEEEAGLIIKAATGAIDSLKRQVELGDLPEDAAAPAAAPSASGRGVPPARPAVITRKPNEAQIAHRHGILLVLSGELQLVVDAFSKLKAQRFREAMEMRQRREKAVQMVEAVVRSARPTAATTRALEEEAAGAGREGESAAQQSVKQMVLSERSSLLQEFGDLTQRVRRAEGTLQDISQLSQLLTDQVLTQSHTIELLYRDAMAATYNIARGNTELKKTVEVRKSARLYLAVYFIIAAFGVLFLDFYHS